jgi:hypothetical protein
MRFKNQEDKNQMSQPDIQVIALIIRITSR